MQVSFVGQQTHVGERERALAEKKLQRLGRYFNGTRDARVRYTVQRNWQIVEVQLDLDGVLLRAEERTSDFGTALDAVVDKLENQVRRFKERIKNHKGKADAPTAADAFAELPEEVTAASEPLPTVARRKRFAIKPMTADEAALQMELLQHDFFAFMNADSDQVSVLYRRKDGNYGLLELDV